MLVALYYLLPFEHVDGAGTLAVLVVGLVGATVLVAWQIRAILRSNFPALRAVEALGLTIPLFLLLFATVYFELYNSSHSSFTQALTRTDSLYFTVVTFSTVGYGDITAKSEAARLVVTLQILADLAVLGFGVRVLLGAVRIGHSRHPAPDGGTAGSVLASSSDEAAGADGH